MRFYKYIHVGEPYIHVPTNKRGPVGPSACWDAQEIDEQGTLVGKRWRTYYGGFILSKAEAKKWLKKLQKKAKDKREVFEGSESL